MYTLSSNFLAEGDDEDKFYAFLLYLCVYVCVCVCVCGGVVWCGVCVCGVRVWCVCVVCLCVCVWCACVVYCCVLSIRVYSLYMLIVSDFVRSNIRMSEQVRFVQTLRQGILK